MKKGMPMRSVSRVAMLFSVVSLSTWLAAGQHARTESMLPKSDGSPPQTLVLSQAEYLDRVQAIWTAQIIGQATGVRFEHQPASILKHTPPTVIPGHAAVDD